ncbi:MAG: sulfatase-like hydrolase/transferase, partial [Opitutaceae bacterium]|nr:sulfatase-like hydrolase/transferase [Opitutaceae bacterium]
MNVTLPVRGKTDRPDIIWIITTQWRGQATGYAGDQNAHTPFLDQLSLESANFPNAYSNHPFGSFARASLLTGRLSPRNGVSDYFDPLPENARTIAHELRESGYQTGYIGKWHLYKRS